MSLLSQKLTVPMQGDSILQVMAMFEKLPQTQGHIWGGGAQWERGRARFECARRNGGEARRRRRRPPGTGHGGGCVTSGRLPVTETAPLRAPSGLGSQQPRPVAGYQRPDGTRPRPGKRPRGRLRDRQRRLRYGVRRRGPRGQLAELREKIRGLEDDNRQLREQLQHSRAREEELEGQVSSLRTELQQSQEERSRWQREAEAQAAERQRLAAELQERHRQLEELREAARDREEQLGAAQAELREVSGVLSRRKAEVSAAGAGGGQEEHLHALEMERRRLHNQLQELKGNIRVFCLVRRCWRRAGGQKGWSTSTSP
eukprot:XP_027304721.1 kinesin-like protein KIFC1 [Anas platyrhynchos]